MTDRVRSASTAGHRGPKMETELLSPRKTMIVLVIVVGCFAVLWPKVFYPMLLGSATQHIKPSPIDKTTGCCDVISETDVNTIKLMSELCGTVVKPPEDKPLTGKEMVHRCRQEVLHTCGIDISVVLQEQVRLGQSVKQILDEVRSLNGSLCLKYNYGVAPWRLGVPHRITVKMASDPSNIRQERPLHLRSELIHPAFRERGRAIPQPQAAPPTRPPPRVVEGRPGPLPGMRPTLGGAGHVVPPSKQGTSSMSVIMPIYTIGIVIFFTYTLMRIIFKKQPEGVGGSLYPPVEPDPHFRKEVFESEASRLGPRLTRENISSKLVVNAMSALLDEVDQEIEARRKSSEVTSQDLVNGTLSNGDVLKPQQTEEQPTVKVLGMEMTASCEGGKKWSRPDSPVLPSSPPPAEPAPPPQEIYLEGALPAQSHLLVADSATESQPTSGEDPAVVLSGKMTLSVISLDGENGTEEAAVQQEPIPVIESVAKLQEEIEEAIQERRQFEDVEQIEEPEFEIEEYVLEPLIVERFDAPPLAQIEIEDLKKKLKESTQTAVVTEEQVEHVIQKPLIHLESEDVANTVEVEVLEEEVDNLIQEAIDNIQKREPISLEILHNLNLQTNEIDDNMQDLEKQIESEKVVEASEEKPTLQVVSEVEKAKLVVEESTPKRDTIVAEGEPILTDNRIEDFIDEVRDESINEKSEPSFIERIEEVSQLRSEAIGNLQTVEEIKQVVTPNEATEILEEKTSSKHVESPQVEEIKEIEPSIEEYLKLPLEISEQFEKTTVDVVETSKPGPIATESKEVVEENTSTKPVEEIKEFEESSKLPVEFSEQFEATTVDEVEISTPGVIEESKKVAKPIEITDKVDETTSTVVEVPQNSEEKPVQISEIIEQAIVEVGATKPSSPHNIEAPKPSSPVIEQPQKIEERLVENAKDGIEAPKSTSPMVEEKPELIVLTDDDELGSEEELVEEIEEILYESHEEESEEESEEEEVARNRTDSSAVQRVNGERSEDLVEESKYTTASGATAAENDISDEELTDNEEDEDEEIIEVEEEIEDDDYIIDESNDVNHVSGESDEEL